MKDSLKEKPALTNFPRSRLSSIVGAKELNCRVRNGNGWDLFAINTGELKNRDK